MRKCGKCKAKLGFFGSVLTCNYADCDYEECNSCYESKNSNLKTCKTCAQIFCIKHIDPEKHGCENDVVADDAPHKDNGDGSYCITINLQNADAIEFKELDRKKADDVYAELKKAISSEQSWYELDVQRIFGKDSYNYEKRMINIKAITELRIMEE